MKNWLSAVFCFVLALPAAAWEVRSDAPRADFEEFHRRFSSAAYAYPRHGAAPLGWVGFEVYADAAVDQDFDDQPYAATVIDGDLTGDLLAVARVGVRKGLPGRVDVGLSLGRALGSGLELGSAEVQWAAIAGGPLSPALSIRLTGTRLLEGGAYDLDQLGAEVLASKGFAVLTPFLGAGVMRSRGRLDSSLGAGFEVTDTQTFLYGGVTLNLLLPKITVEVEKADVVQAAVRVGFGL